MSLEEIKAQAIAAKSQADLVVVAIQELIKESETATADPEEIIYPSAEMLNCG